VKQCCDITGFVRIVRHFLRIALVVLVVFLYGVFLFNMF
jgi:hypothetical protein